MQFARYEVPRAEETSVACLTYFQEYIFLFKRFRRRINYVMLYVQIFIGVELCVLMCKKYFSRPCIKLKSRYSVESSVCNLCRLSSKLLPPE